MPQLLEDELPSRFKPTIDVDRTDERLEGGRPHRGRHVRARTHALAQLQVLGELEFLRNFGADLPTDHHRFDLGHLPFQDVREGLVDVAADHHAQYGVTEELQSLIALETVIGPGGMRYRTLKEIVVLELVTEGHL